MMPAAVGTLFWVHLVMAAAPRAVNGGLQETFIQWNDIPGICRDCRHAGDEDNERCAMHNYRLLLIMRRFCVLCELKNSSFSCFALDAQRAFC